MKNILLGLIFLGIFCSARTENKHHLTLEQIWLKGTFSPKSVHGLSSMKDGLHYTVLEKKDNRQQINKYSYDKGALVGTVLQNDLKREDGSQLDIEAYQFSDDEKLLLLTTLSEPIYRHSMKSDYYVYSLEKRRLSRVGFGKCQLASFSPDSKYVSYMRDNNLFLYDFLSDKEIAVTTDGRWNHIINGAPDWVYEEEFTLVKAYAWSPDASHIAYYRFDESAVREFSFPMYTGLYPENYVYKYPKAGEVNSRVEIQTYTPSTGNRSSARLDNTAEYVPRIAWTHIRDVLSIQQMNRLQNSMKLVLLDVKSQALSTVVEQTSDTYMEVQDFHFLKDKKTFIGINETSGYNQLYQYTLTETEKEGKKVFQGTAPVAISPAGREVSEWIGINEEKGLVYYKVFDAADATRQEAMVYDMKAKKNTVFVLPDGSNRLDASATMRYFINFNSAPERPLSVVLYNDLGKKIRVLEDNQALKDTIAGYAFGKKEYFKFTGRSGDELQGWMIKPEGFKNGVKYPVLMFVYGGPGSQTVTAGWGGANDLWFRFLADQGYMVVSVDNRGTGGRGKQFRDCTYGQLGNLETEDQVDAALYLGSLDYVDKNRIGIWGWSYGGYMSTLCLAKGNGVFKMAMAVAPVTNWRFYDSIYTERYMGLPSQNEKGYDENSPVHHAGKIKGPFLLVHGTADDNVHFQNTAELIDALVKHNVPFELAVYPDKNHGIYGGNTRYHLFTKMTEFIKRHL